MSSRFGRRVSAKRQVLLDPDGIAVVEWDHIVQLVSAASQRDGQEYRRASERLAAHPVDDRRMALYMFRLLRERLYSEFGEDVTFEQLDALATRIFPDFRACLTYDRDVMLGNMCSVTGVAGPVPDVRGARGTVAGMVTLGVLLDNPEAQLVPMRRNLARYWQEDRETLRELGAYP